MNPTEPGHAMNLTDHLIPKAMQAHIVQKINKAFTARKQRVDTVNKQHPGRHDLQRRMEFSEPIAIPITYHLRCESCNEEFSVTGIFSSFQRVVNSVLAQHSAKSPTCELPQIILNHKT